MLGKIVLRSFYCRYIQNVVKSYSILQMQLSMRVVLIIAMAM